MKHTRHIALPLTMALGLMLSSTVLAQETQLPNGKTLQPAHLSYQIVMNMMGQEMTLKGERKIRQATYQDRPVWRLVDQGESPWGPYADTVEVDRETLLPLRQKSQGSGNIILHYSETGVTGSMEGQGGSMPIKTPFEGTVFGHESGLEMALAGMNFSVGDSTVVQSFHAYSQKVRRIAVQVTGTENITVPAGELEALVLKLTPLDGDSGEVWTLHVMPETPHYVIQGDYQLPSNMGGGNILVTLLSHEVAKE